MHTDEDLADDGTESYTFRSLIYYEKKQCSKCKKLRKWYIVEFNMTNPITTHWGLCRYLVDEGCLDNSGFALGILWEKITQLASSGLDILSLSNRICAQMEGPDEDEFTIVGWDPKKKVVMDLEEAICSAQTTERSFTLTDTDGMVEHDGHTAVTEIGVMETVQTSSIDTPPLSNTQPVRQSLPPISLLLSNIPQTSAFQPCFPRLTCNTRHVRQLHTVLHQSNADGESSSNNRCSSAMSMSSSSSSVSSNSGRKRPTTTETDFRKIAKIQKHNYRCDNGNGCTDCDRIHSQKLPINFNTF
ncbi:hypothetical protein niasHT_003198 [Heterodera trifolii]|uniref:Uncharacterized protein n=1 Tax=Heterodera trifolii TaxID=157864 RepID=A0ABD2LPL9_9BILA